MRLPHIVDYLFSDDDLLLDAKIKPAVIEEVLYDNNYEKKFRIRLIHHFGYKTFLGGQKIVKGYFYDRPYGEDGIQSIITPNMQLLIPRREKSIDSSKIILSKKNVYRIKALDEVKEIVLDKDNKPKVIDYKMEKYKGFSDCGINQKGRFYILGKDYEVVVM